MGSDVAWTVLTSPNKQSNNWKIDICLLTNLFICLKGPTLNINQDKEIDELHDNLSKRVNVIYLYNFAIKENNG